MRTSRETEVDHFNKASHKMKYTKIANES